MSAEIRGIEQYTPESLAQAVWRGGKFVQYQWVVSALVLTFRHPSPIFFIPPGQSPVAPGYPYSIASALLGWWGIPWGIVFTISALVSNSRGGVDVTAECRQALGIGFAPESFDLSKSATQQYTSPGSAISSPPREPWNYPTGQPGQASRNTTRKTYDVDRME